MNHLTYRQRRFVQALENGRSYARAARDAGYADSTSSVAGRIARHPAIARELQANRSRQESLTRHEETALRLESIDTDARGIVERLIQALAEKDIIQARFSIWSLQEFCNEARK
jgi:phage terminase small subunit